MSEHKDDWILDVQREWMSNFNGFSLDIGGSVIKIVYRHKKDWEELKDTNKGRLRFMSFSRADRQLALDVLKENCHVTGNTGTDAAAIFTTGVGSFQFSKLINEKFNVKIENLIEFTAFVQGFTSLLNSVPKEELYYPECTEEERKIQAYAKETSARFAREGMEAMQEPRIYPTTLKTLYEQEVRVPECGMADPDDIFPCVLAMIGSGRGIYIVNKDGSFRMEELSARGGRMFIAQGSLMTGAKTYDELTELAARGNPYNVHYTNADIQREAMQHSDGGDPDSVYAKIGEHKEQSYLYCMGKAAGKDRDDFNKEDVAAALLQMTAADACQVVSMLHQRLKFKRVFWCGSFIKAEVVRRYLTLEFRRCSIFPAMFLGECEWVPSHFLKHGPYLGALGCVINSVDQFLMPPSEVAAERQAENEKQPAVEKQAATEKPAADDKEAAADEEPVLEEKPAVNENEAAAEKPEVDEKQATVEKPASEKKPTVAVYIDGDE